MADLDKTIHGLECCTGIGCHNGCGYADLMPKCSMQFKKDALELLKEQQPKKVTYDINGLTGLPVSFCPSCGEGVDMYAYGRNDLKQVFCPYCGQALDWKDGEKE